MRSVHPLLLKPTILGVSRAEADLVGHFTKELVSYYVVRRELGKVHFLYSNLAGLNNSRRKASPT
jgi:uncharacterized membrane protein YjdF